MVTQRTQYNKWISLYKPRGISSNDILMDLKKLLNPEKIGHAGTLDPLAEGILPVALGQATRLVEYLHLGTKTYEFTIKFGAETSTDDEEGEITATTDILPTWQQIEEVLPEFIGHIKQAPPAFSAIKINGKRAYDSARSGVEFEVPERVVFVKSLEVGKEQGVGQDLGIRSLDLEEGSEPSLNITSPAELREMLGWGQSEEGTSEPQNLRTLEKQDWIPAFAGMTVEDDINSQSQTSNASSQKPNNLTSITLICECGSGTYIRSLARDIARKCGSLGHVAVLKRIKYGGFDLKNSLYITPEHSQDLRKTPKNTENFIESLQKLKESAINLLHPLDAGLDDIPVLHLEKSGFLKILDGVRLCKESSNHKLYRAYFENKLVSIMRFRMVI